MIKKQVDIPDDLFPRITREAHLQGISLNKLIILTLQEKYSQQSEDASTKKMDMNSDEYKDAQIARIQKLMDEEKSRNEANSGL